MLFAIYSTIWATVLPVAVANAIYEAVKDNDVNKERKAKIKDEEGRTIGFSTYKTEK